MPTEPSLTSERERHARITLTVSALVTPLLLLLVDAFAPKTFTPAHFFITYTNRFERGIVLLGVTVIIVALFSLILFCIMSFTDRDKEEHP